MSTISDNLKSLNQSKQDIKNAIIEKGITPAGGLTTYSDAIQPIVVFDIEGTGWEKDQFPYESEKTFPVNLFRYNEVFSDINYTKQKYSEWDSMNNFAVSLYENDLKLIYAPFLDTLYVNNMNKMFKGCVNLTAIPHYNTYGVENFSEMFQGCRDITYTPEFSISSATNLSNMYNGCNKLVSVKFKEGHTGIDCSNMFEGITTNGIAYFKKDGDYSDIINVLPATWKYSYYN